MSYRENGRTDGHTRQSHIQIQIKCSGEHLITKKVIKSNQLKGILLQFKVVIMNDA